ncbi:serine/threonine protein kinase [Nostoc sp. C117]|uniref:serine/threonine protein kinase n=1 Tax=Nostoc sp. C117 TaxID=3349875 RepID=UPI00370D0118
MIGEILGEFYQVQQLLGKKAGRRTLLARDLKTQELVVIKLLSFNSDFEWDDLKLFEREAQTLKSLSHPFIPRYLDYFEVNLPTIKGFALVQSYIPAQTLEQYLQTGRTFTEAEIKEIAKAVLEILIYLHGLHPPVIHRDLKPSNILLSVDAPSAACRRHRSGNSVGEVYLVDFGSVQTVLAIESGTRTVVGTYGYMPQEQFGGRTVAVSDLYSLGATLIYLVTGIHPADLPQKDFRIQFEQAANVSPKLTRWLQQMTEPSIEKRFSSANVALAALGEPQLQNAGTLTAIKPIRTKVKLTKIQLYKTEDVLEIIIPPANFRSMISDICFAICWSTPIFFGTITTFYGVPFSFNFNSLIMLFLCGVGFCFIYRIVFNLFGHTLLHIDSRKITLNYNLFGFLYLCQSSHLDSHSITKLVYIPKHSRETPHATVEEPAQLEIWAGTKKYQLSIPINRVNTEVESEWLAQELSDWLGIEIEKVS